jgi:hypothetical protein
MATWGKWVALVGGVLAVIAQFVSVVPYLALIGGVVAIIGALAS